MDWQGALRARLIAAAPVTALVGQRVYWVDRPQLSALPAITLQTVTGARPQHMAGFSGFDAATVQVDAWGNTYAEVTAAMNAAIAALVPAQSGNGIEFSRAFLDTEPRDLGEQTGTQFVHRKQVDILFHHSTTA